MTKDQAAVAKAIRQTVVFTQLDAHTIRCVALLIQNELELIHPQFDGAAFMLACGLKTHRAKGDRK